MGPDWKWFYGFFEVCVAFTLDFLSQKILKVNGFEKNTESDLTCLCQTLRTGVEKDSFVNQKEWKQSSPIVNPSSQSPRVS